MTKSIDVSAGDLVNRPNRSPFVLGKADVFRGERRASFLFGQHVGKRQARAPQKKAFCASEKLLVKTQRKEQDENMELAF